MSRVKGYGGKLYYGDTADYTTAATWTAIANVVELKPAEQKVDDIDVSNMDSPADSNGIPHEEFDPGWANSGDADATVQFAKTINATIYGLKGVAKAYKIAFNDGSIWRWNGYLNKFGNEVDRKGIVTMKIGVKISGIPKYDAAS